MRKAGLDEVGELSTENLAFKKLRDDGIIEQLKEMKKEKIDKQLTLESLDERPPMTFNELINNFKDNIEQYKLDGKDVYENIHEIIKETLPIYIDDMINVYITSNDYFDPHLDDTLEEVMLKAIETALNNYFIRNMNDLV